MTKQQYRTIDHPDVVYINRTANEVVARTIDTGYRTNKYEKQEIHFDSSAAPERQRAALFKEIANLLLWDTGVLEENDKPLHDILERNLYTLFRANNFAFIRASKMATHCPWPSSLNILGVEYDVNIRQMDDRLGHCDFTPAEIVIHEDLPYDRKCKTLIHEVMHALLFEADYQKYGDEPTVRKLTVALYNLLLDNDFAWLYECVGNEAVLPTYESEQYPDTEEEMLPFGGVMGDTGPEIKAVSSSDIERLLENAVERLARREARINRRARRNVL